MSNGETIVADAIYPNELSTLGKLQELIAQKIKRYGASAKIEIACKTHDTGIGAYEETYLEITVTQSHD